jgi:hypothetical protein
MAIPLLEELQLKQYDQDYLMEVLTRSRINKAPVFIKLKTEDRGEAIEQLKNLRESLRKLKIHPRFPYPIYILTALFDYYDDFIVMRDEKEITSHFKIKSKRPNNREQLILNKVNLVVEKVNNLDIDGRYQSVIDNKESVKKLYKLSKESWYYEKILRELVSANKKKG